MIRNLREVGKAEDTVFVQRGKTVDIKETGHFGTIITIDKFDDPDNKISVLFKKGSSVEEAIRQGAKYLGKVIVVGNTMLNEGIQALWDLAAGLASVTAWNNANARVGVGESTTAEDPAQTGLVGVTIAYKGMDTGYPTRTGNKVAWRGTYGAAEGIQPWNEFTVDNGAAQAYNLNRKVSAQGTKVSGQTWVLTITIGL